MTQNERIEFAKGHKDGAERKECNPEGGFIYRSGWREGVIDRLANRVARQRAVKEIAHA